MEDTSWRVTSIYDDNNKGDFCLLVCVVKLITGLSVERT